MNSTQLSESFNKSLKDYFKSNDVVQFFMHFERSVEEKRYKELVAEYSLNQKLPNIIVPVAMIIEAGNTYTNVIFEDFQKEYFRSLEAQVKTVTHDGENLVYTITMYGSSWERQVTKGNDNILSCTCRLFERKGILCGHAIKVLKDVMNFMELPNHYIIKRWTRKARAELVQDMHGRVIEADANLQRTTWYRSLCSIFTRISSRASESEEAYNVSVLKANELLKIIEEMLGLQVDNMLEEGERDAFFSIFPSLKRLRLSSINFGPLDY